MTKKTAAAIATIDRRVAVHYREIATLHLQRARLIALDWEHTPAPKPSTKRRRARR